MSACEKCWREASLLAASRQESTAEIYAELVRTNDCTPEEQAGAGARECSGCGRKVLHQYTGECMAGCGPLAEGCVWRGEWKDRHEIYTTPEGMTCRRCGLRWRASA